MVNTEETTVETLETTDTTNTVDIETLQAQLKEAEEKNKTLGDKIYKLKKENKSTETPETGLTQEQLEKFYQEKKFFESKPELVEYKDKFNEFTSKGLTLAQAEKLVVDANPDIVARQNTQKANFTAGVADYSNGTQTQEQVANMPFAERKVFMEKYMRGEVNIK